MRGWGNSFNIKGNEAYVIKDKLKSLKEKLRHLNKEVFDWIDLSIDNTVKDLNEIEFAVGKGKEANTHTRK